MNENKSIKNKINILNWICGYIKLSMLDFNITINIINILIILKINI